MPIQFFYLLGEVLSEKSVFFGVLVQHNKRNFWMAIDLSKQQELSYIIKCRSWTTATAIEYAWVPTISNNHGGWTSGNHQ